MSTAVSAPGKVLLAGGYLVLDRAYTGLVFGLSARIHVLVHDIDTSSGVELSEIVVQSPQFLEASWNYGYHLTGHDGGVDVTQLQGYEDFFLLEVPQLGINLPLTLYSNHTTPLSKNPFVEKALLYALTYIATVLGPSHVLKPTRLTILADNDYYSNPAAPSTPSNPYPSFNVRLQDAHKTGLGSSAALVTAFTGALLSHYLPSSSFSLDTDEGRAKLHNLSQASHCAAQGKVGSGFDVAAAVYGTCVYRRFSPSILSSIGEPGSPGFAGRVKAVVEDEGKKWDTEISKRGVTIPEGMALVMCDVDCGSQTVGMVKKVLAWKEGDVVGSKMLWDELQRGNVRLGEKLAKGEIGKLKEAFGGIRGLIREMGEKSGVPTEPQEQTDLLDAVSAVDGVEGGVVPGAGGYDAIALLVKDDEKTLEVIKAFLVKWSEEKKSNVKLLEAKGELEGAKKEGIASYGQFA